MQVGPPGGEMIPHRAPPAQNGSGGSGGRAPRGGPGAAGAGAALDTLAQPCQSSESDAARLKLAKRARAKYATLPRAVSLAELRTPLEKAYRNTVYCSNTLRQSSDGTISSRYCGNRWCLACCRIQTARSIRRYGPELDTWGEKMFVTLTIPNDSGDRLGEWIDLILRAIPQMSRAIKRTDGLEFRAVRKLECTFNFRRGDYHPHLHLIVEGRAQAEALVGRWLELFPTARRAAQDIRPCRPGEAKELFKYFTKLATKASDGTSLPIPVEALDVIFAAMRGRRVYQSVGFTLPKSPAQDEEAPLGRTGRTAAPSRIGESITWDWSQESADWLDGRTGEFLTCSGLTANVVEEPQYRVRVAEGRVDRVTAGEANHDFELPEITARRSGPTYDEIAGVGYSQKLMLRSVERNHRNEIDLSIHSRPQPNEEFVECWPDSIRKPGQQLLHVCG